VHNVTVVHHQVALPVLGFISFKGLFVKFYVIMDIFQYKIDVINVMKLVKLAMGRTQIIVYPVLEF